MLNRDPQAACPHQHRLPSIFYQLLSLQYFPTSTIYLVLKSAQVNTGPQLGPCSDKSKKRLGSSSKHLPILGL